MASRCPVTTLQAWLAAAAITEGPVFRSVSTGNQRGLGPMNPASVNVLVQNAVARADLDPACYSAHSLRAGFVTYGPGSSPTPEVWLKERAIWPHATTNSAVFLNCRGARLSTRGAYNALAGIAEAAGIDVGRNADFTPHVRRHTAGTTMTRAAS